MLNKKSINRTVIELIDIWKKVSGATVPGYNCFQSVKTVKKKFNKLLGQYRLAVRAGENPSTKAPIQHKESFETVKDDLFDISNPISNKSCVSKIITSLLINKVTGSLLLVTMIKTYSDVYFAKGRVKMLSNNGRPDHRKK